MSEEQQSLTFNEEYEIIKDSNCDVGIKLYESAYQTNKLLRYLLDGDDTHYGDVKDIYDIIDSSFFKSDSIHERDYDLKYQRLGGKCDLHQHSSIFKSSNY